MIISLILGYITGIAAGCIISFMWIRHTYNQRRKESAEFSRVIRGIINDKLNPR